MIEVWLQSNRRVLLLAMVPAGLLGGLGLVAVIWAAHPLLRGLGWPAMVVSLVLMFGLGTQMVRPRVGYDHGQVLFYLRAGGPIRVPIHVVEAFFLGQGPARLPGGASGGVKTVNLVARLSQREPEWQSREIKPGLGKWSDGYVTIRGAWCEPLNGEVVRRLNRRLGEMSRAAQSADPGEKT